MSNVGKGSVAGQLLVWDTDYGAFRWLPASAPTANYILSWNGSEPTWISAPGGFTAGGDLSGSPSSQTVIGLRGRSIASTAPTDGQVLTWVAGSSNWAPVTPSGGGGGSTPNVYATVANAEAATGADNDICYVVATESWYRYEATDASVASVEHKVFLSTGNGGNTRWMAIAGRYGNIANSVMPVGSGSYPTTETFLGYAALSSLSTGYNNTCLGFQAGMSLTSGVSHTYIGANAGLLLEAGYQNTFIGDHAGASCMNSNNSSNVALGAYAFGGTSGPLYSSSGVFIGVSAGYYASGHSNTYIGMEAGYGSGGNCVGSYNLGIGYRALYTGPGHVSTSDGWYNCAIGTQAGFNLTWGSYNQLYGYQAGYDLTTGSYNIQIGGSLTGITTGSYNVCVGGRVLGALASNRSYAVGIGYQSGGNGGDNTVYIGNSCGLNTGLAPNNIGIGNLALQGGTGTPLTGEGNVALGRSALAALEGTAANNVGVGLSAGAGIIDGSDNVCLGTQAGQALAHAGQNVAVGAGALLSATAADLAYTRNVGVGRFAGIYITSGTDNTCLGALAGQTLTTGTYNTCVGAFSDVDSGASFRRTAIGAYAVCLYDSSVRLGVVSYPVYGGAYNTDSDARIKTCIEDCDLGLDFVMALKPRKYELKESPDKKHHGFIAQEVQAVLKELGVESNIHSAPEGNGLQSVSYTAMVAPLVKAVQELTALVEALRVEIVELEMEAK